MGSVLSHFSSFCATLTVAVLPVNVSYVSAFIVQFIVMNQEKCSLQAAFKKYGRRHPITPVLLGSIYQQLTRKSIDSSPA